MAFDSHSNLALSAVAVAPVPALTGLSLSVTAGQGILFPTAPFNCTVWPAGAVPTSANAEIVRVTAVVGDTFTITRAQEGTAARSIIAGDQIAATITVKTLTDVESATPKAFSAQGGSSTFSTLSFGNANGVTFSNNAGVVQASYTVPSTAGLLSNINVSAGTTSNNLSNLTFSNANGVSFGLDGSTVTASVGAGAAPGSISAGTTSVALGQAVFSNSNGVTFGLNGSTVTASHNGLTSQSNQAFSADGGSSAFQTLSFSNANGISFSNNVGQVQASYTVPSTAGLISAINVSAGTTSNNLASVTFSNSNGVSFGINASTITASHNAITSQSNQQLTLFGTGGTTDNTSATANASSLLFLGAGNVSVGFSNGSIEISGGTAAASPVNFSAGTTSNNLSSVVFSDSNNVSFGLNGSTITASAGPAMSFYAPFWAMSGHATNSALVNNNLYFMPFDVQWPLSASRVNFFVSLSCSMSAANSTGSGRVGIGYALYTRDMTGGANSDRLSVLTSYSMTLLSQTMNSNTQYVATHFIGLSNATSHSTSQVGLSTSNASTYQSTSLNGNRVVQMPLGLSLTPGHYWMAFAMSSASGNAMINGLSVAITSQGNWPQFNNFGVNSSASNASFWRPIQGWGTYSATTASFPNSIAYTTDDIRVAAGQQTYIHFEIAGYGTSTNII